MRRFLFAGAVAASLLAASVPLHAQQQGGNLMPPGEGHDIVAVACTQCHAPTAFTRLREGATAWRAQVYDMILRGAQVSPGDVDAVVTYLATNFGPGVNVPPSRPVTLPDGPGKNVVETHCSVCHGLDRLAAAKRSPDEWQGIMARMMFFGAPVSADEAKTITAYLDATLGAK